MMNLYILEFDFYNLPGAARLIRRVHDFHIYQTFESTRNGCLFLLDTFNKIFQLIVVQALRTMFIAREIETRFDFIEF